MSGRPQGPYTVKKRSPVAGSGNAGRHRGSETVASTAFRLFRAGGARHLRPGGRNAGAAEMADVEPGRLGGYTGLGGGRADQAGGPGEGEGGDRGRAAQDCGAKAER